MGSQYTNGKFLIRHSCTFSATCKSDLENNLSEDTMTCQKNKEIKNYLNNIVDSIIYKTTSGEINTEIYSKDISYIDLSSRKIASIINITGLENVRTLRLTDNKLSSIEQLGKMKNLQHLNIDQNLLENVDGLEKVSSLHTLTLNDNLFTSLLNIKKLSSLHEIGRAHV